VIWHNSAAKPNWITALKSCRPCKVKSITLWCEHDYYLDLGEYWEKLFGPQYHSFDHKGVHFIILNSIRTYDDWTFKRWPTNEQRTVGNGRTRQSIPVHLLWSVEEQRKWLKNDLAKINKNTPVVVFSHSPLQKIYKGWNFWTEDADQIQALLKPFKQVSVIYGHVHQIQYNQIGNISFNSVMATSWPWPYPRNLCPSEQYLPKLTVPMNHGPIRFLNGMARAGNLLLAKWPRGI